MGEYQTVKLSIEDRTAILTIDHPPANAFNGQQLQDLNAAFDEVTESEQVKVIIITAAGLVLTSKKSLRFRARNRLTRC